MARTNGNVRQSLEFAFYCIAVKIGLFVPNFNLKSNQYHLESNQNQQIEIVRCAKAIPIYNPYVSVFDESRPSGLSISNVEEQVKTVQHYSSHHSQEVINELRAGDSRLTQAAWLFITIWMLQQQSVGFQPVKHTPPPPHFESARN